MQPGWPSRRWEASASPARWVEGPSRSLAAELVRTRSALSAFDRLGLRRSRLEDAWKLRRPSDLVARGALRFTGALTLLGRLPTLAEVDAATALLASDYASPLTVTVVNGTCGEIADLADQPGEGSCRRRLAKRLHRQDRKGYRLPEHVDALLSDLGIDTEEASQVRAALRSAAPESPRSSRA